MGDSQPGQPSPHYHLSSVVTMSGLSRDTHPSSKLFDLLAASLSKMSEAEKKETLKKVNGIFEMRITNAQGAVEGWIIDMKKKGEVVKVEKDSPKIKPDVTINMSDDTFQQLADGKLNCQKAFMTGRLKVKGNIMLATKLDTVLKNAQAKL